MEETEDAPLGARLREDRMPLRGRSPRERLSSRGWYQIVIADLTPKPARDRIGNLEHQM